MEIHKGVRPIGQWYEAALPGITGLRASRCGQAWKTPNTGSSPFNASGAIFTLNSAKCRSRFDLRDSFPSKNGGQQIAATVIWSL